jgi:hypothetical protein
MTTVFPLTGNTCLPDEVITIIVELIFGVKDNLLKKKAMEESLMRYFSLAQADPDLVKNDLRLTRNYLKFSVSF